MTNTSNWPREVIDIEQLKTVFDDNDINITDELDIVLRQRAHVDLPYGKRYQHVRFATILGAVYVPDSIYKEKEREKHLKKLRRYYDQNATKSYIKLETAEFYCNFLDQIKDSIEQRHPGVKLPLISIDKPLEKQEHFHGSGSKKEKKTKTLNDKIVKIDRYQVINPSCLQKLSADELSKLLDEVFQKRSADLTSTADKDKLLNLISNIKYAFAYAQNDGKSLEQNSHLNQARRLYNYRAGQNLTPQTQKLYVTYMEAVEERLRNEHPDYQVVYDEIPLLYENNQPEPRPGPGPEPGPEPKPRPGPEPKPRPGPEPKPRPEPEPNNKILDGYTSDEWAQLLMSSPDGEEKPVFLEMTEDVLHLTEGLEITTLREVLGDKFPQNFNNLSPEDKEAKLQELKNNLNHAELAKFNVGLTNKAQILAESLPPHQLVIMAQDIDKQLEGENGASDEKKQQLQTLKTQKEVLVAAMAAKTKGVALGDIIIDQTNVADVYDGAVEMFDYLQNSGLSIEGEGEFSFAELLTAARNKLDQEITAYDADNGLSEIKENNAAELEQTFNKAWQKVTEVDFANTDNKKAVLGEQLAAKLDALQFEDPDADEKKQTFIETIKLEAARNAAVRGIGKDGDAFNEELVNQLRVTAGNHIQTLIATEAIANLPEDATDEQRRQAIAAALEQPQAKISNKGLAAYQAATVNNHISFLNRLAGKAHLNNRSAPVLSKMYGPLQKIDKACIARFGQNYTIVRKFGRMIAGNMGAQALNQVMRIGCNTVGLALGTPGLGSQIYAGIYAAQALTRLGMSFAQERREAKARGEKYGFGKFLLQKSPEILMTAAVTTSIFFGGEIAKRGMEAAVRYGTMAVGFGISLVKGIRAQRKAGNKWGKAIAKAFANSAASTATAVATGMGMAWGVNNLAAEITNNTSLDLWGEHGTRQPTADEYNPDDASYSKDTVGSDKLDNYKNMTPEELNRSGIIKEGLPRDEAAGLINQTDEQLADKGLVRSETSANDPNGVKIVDEPAGVAYAKGAVENAKDILEMWTKDASGLLDDNISKLQPILEEWNARFPDKAMDAHRLLLIAGDCGAQMVNADIDTNMHHVDHSDTPAEVHGNHKVFGSQWCEANNFNHDIIKHIASVTDANGHIIPEKLSPDTLWAIAELDAAVSAHNEVGHINGAPVHTDGVLARNASADGTGVFHHVDDGKGEVFTTYADGDGKITIPEKAHYERIDEYSKVTQHSFIPFTTTFDRIYGGAQKVKQSLNRIMGANGKHRENVNADGTREKPAGIKPVNLSNGRS